ncbi:MAG: hypothetical protein H0X37_01430 [Herpetosiphonaceae bacterium]|nr:hypothetical protein [Herpetosiphonaceae bacterium]
MTDSHASDASQLHPAERYDQLTDGKTASDSTTRSAQDVGSMPSAGQGAVETEMTPLTPPSADSDTNAGAASADDDFDPADEITPG